MKVILKVPNDIILLKIKTIPKILESIILSLLKIKSTCTYTGILSG